MSAQLTTIQAQREEWACYVTPLGYVACCVCKPAGSQRSTERHTSDTRCEMCGVDLDYSVELIEGSATIERALCRVF